MGLEVLRAREERLVRRDQRQAAPIGEIQQLRLDGALLRETVALEFDIQPVAEQPLQRLEPRQGRVDARLAEQNVERAVGAAREGDQIGAVAGEIRQRDAGRIAWRGGEIGARAQPHQIAIAGLGFGQQHQIGVRGLPLPLRAAPGITGIGVAEIHGELHAGNRLHADLLGFLRKLQRREQIIGVRHGERGLRVLFGQRNEPAERQRALAQRKGGVGVKMDEAGVRDHAPILTRVMRASRVRFVCYSLP